MTLDPLGVFNTARDIWKGRRRLRIVQVDWGWETRGDRERPVVYVRVVNDGYRPLRIDGAGTIHRGPGGGYKVAGVEGVPLDLSDGQDGELVLFPLDHEAFGYTPPAAVWVGLTTGHRFSAQLPPQPQPSSGDSSNGDF
jgi:hypothetical protein